MLFHVKGMPADDSNVTLAVINKKNAMLSYTDKLEC